jgi:uncharacterized protein with HEPN domain
MRSREWRLRLEDILEAIVKIQRYTAGTDYKTFRTDERSVDAVVRNLAIIGEAARHIPQEVQDRHPHIPWEKMRGIRNVIIHEYFGVDISILWQTLKEDLPPLVQVLKEVVERESNL